MRSACRPCLKRLPLAIWGWKCSAFRASATWPRVCCRSRSITLKSWRRRGGSVGNSSRCWRASLVDSDQERLSVALVDVNEGCEAEFMTLARTLASLILRKGYGRAVTVRDEAMPSRFYTVRHWSTAAAAEQCHGDAESQAITARLYQIARVTQVVNGVRHLDHSRLLMEDRRARAEADRAFTRIAIVADTDAPTPPCGACRQILWEFGGNLEIILASLTEEKGRHQLQDLLPLPFDARLL